MVLDRRTQRIVQDVRDLALVSSAIRHEGDIAVAQLLAGNVVRLSDRSVLLDGLFLPLGLVSHARQLYVSDWATGLIWAVAPDGSRSVFASELQQPEGMAVARGWLFVVEEGADRVSAIDLRTGERAVLAHVDVGERHSVAGMPHGNFNGIAVDEERRRLYVSADDTNQVLAFKLDFGAPGAAPSLSTLQPE